jgi:hypothetical protein|tara:strand:+ start:192 stop:1061 length:870 start_codon:yes stop_codon:yes gene_type:complete
MEKIVTTSRGKDITAKDVEDIKNIITRHYHKGRKHISRELSRHWRWYQPNGNLKDMACREILLKLHRQGLVKLPPRMAAPRGNKNFSQLALDMEPVNISGKLSSFDDITLTLAQSESKQALWRSLVRGYHYQGYKRMVGRSLKYTAYIEDTPIACLGWGSAAWSISPRDSYIGWDRHAKDRNLSLIANNTRFLILPGINIKYLASHLLSANIKRIRGDWKDKYGTELYLLETFVECGRFSGTSYRAANWTHLGQTRGYSKKGASHLKHENIKDIYVYPLVKDFREKLKS